MKRYITAAFLAVFLFSAVSGYRLYAHRPVIVGGEGSRDNPVVVDRPQISWAYYGKLEGEPRYFKIVSKEPFKLYVNILVPDYSPDGEPILSHDLSFEIFNGDTLVYRAQGLRSRWTRFYEPYGKDHYYMGPEYEKEMEAGEYMVRVFNSTNNGKYSLAIGTIEKFTIVGLIEAIDRAKSLDEWFFKQ
ncbi:MAG TPA: hypothetical protein VMZ05_08660 [Spirochaetota bacterium]|nr:hypothetical protein [Spirochaetota bacterium]